MQIWKVCIFKHKIFCWSTKYCTSFTCSEFWIGYLLNTCIWSPGAGRSTPPCHHVLAWTYLQRQFAVWTILHETLIPEKKHHRIKIVFSDIITNLYPEHRPQNIYWPGSMDRRAELVFPNNSLVRKSDFAREPSW